MREAVRYLTDDRDLPKEERNELVIMQGGNGDWYVSVVPEGTGTFGKAVRICTSGGASTQAPGLTRAIYDAYHAIQGTKPLQMTCPSCSGKGGSRDHEGKCDSEEKDWITCRMCQGTGRIS